MKWTKEPPTEPGYYWWRLTPEHMHQQVQVCGEVLYVVATIGDHPIALPVSFVPGEWWPERIPEPVEDRE